MIERKFAAMQKRFGSCGVLRCKDCCHLKRLHYHDRVYYKCELYGLSHGESTDWRLHFPACGMYDMEVDMENWNPVLEQVIHAPKGPEPPLKGQVKFNI